MTDVATSPDEDKPRLTLKQTVIKELREWGVTLSVFVPLFLLFSGLVYELRVIPSESMVPNLQVGDRVAVNKFAYGYSRNSLPFSFGRYIPLPDGRVFASQPERGDVAVFEHPHTPRVMIKRIVGIPGDEIQLVNSQIYLNGEPIDRELVRRIRYVEHSKQQPVTALEYREDTGDENWLSHSFEGGGLYGNTVTFIVPEGHFFFMGDNRDNSLDARNVSGHCRESSPGVIDEAGCPPRPGVRLEDASVGFVPFNNLIGRADTVLFTTYRCSRGAAEPCMKNRWLRGL
ncbi:MAG: signal peptidase I [Henriciella sp.]|nr:signal peptidase I [Henriciella sp.]